VTIATGGFVPSRFPRPLRVDSACSDDCALRWGESDAVGMSRKSPGQSPFFARGGAGGNRTPVHQAETVRATTVPDLEADATSPAGRLTTSGPRLVFPGSQWSFHTVSGLSRRHPPLLLPGCGGSTPCGLAAHDVSLQPDCQAARANCSLAILVFAPFNESEQLGSHARPPKLMSKPVSPVGCAQLSVSGRRSPQSMPLRWRPSALAMSRAASRSAIAWRWSPLRRPRARASSTLARPSLK
jgi:hypothetical protein